MEHKHHWKSKISQKGEIQRKKISKKWSALIVALVVLTLLTVMSTTFFEKLYRFAQASQGIENSNAAYYKALGAIEDSLYAPWVSKYTPWQVQNISAPTNKSGTGRGLTASTGWTSVPMPGEGNSPYDTNYNTIGLGEPVQLVIPDVVNWTNVDFQFRIPSINGSNTGILWGPANSSGYILWTFASTGASLFASGETNIFRWFDIDNTTKPIEGYWWTSNSGDLVLFDTFYWGTPTPYVWINGGNCAWFNCTLKLSLIRPIVTSDGRTLTFLEYKITWFNTTIPTQYMNLRAEWYSYWFLRTRDLKFPQITTNTALDFAVLQ